MIFTSFFVMPLVVSAAVEYGTCRIPRRRFWRYLPPVISAAAFIGVTLYRYHGWSAAGEKAPLETLLFFPGLPALGVFLGLLIGWRVWCFLWRPKVVRDKDRKEE